MKNETQHNIRVITEIWNELEKQRNDINSGRTTSAQWSLIDVGYTLYDLVDTNERRGRGIRVPVLRPASEIIDKFDVTNE